MERMPWAEMLLQRLQAVKSTQAVCTHVVLHLSKSACTFFRQTKRLSHPCARFGILGWRQRRCNIPPFLLRQAPVLAH